MEYIFIGMITRYARWALLVAESRICSCHHHDPTDYRHRVVKFYEILCIVHSWQRFIFYSDLFASVACLTFLMERKISSEIPPINCIIIICYIYDLRIICAMNSRSFRKIHSMLWWLLTKMFGEDALMYLDLCHTLPNVFVMHGTAIISSLIM